MPSRDQTPSGQERQFTVWPCDHGGVQVELVGVRPFYFCDTCGAHPILVRAVDERDAKRLIAWADGSPEISTQWKPPSQRRSRA